VKVRDDLARGDYGDPGWYRNPEGTVARRVSDDRDFGNPARRKGG
jgi:manganese oxidase